MSCITKKQLLLLATLLFFNHKTSTYVITTTHHYTYTTPLSYSLVLGELSGFLEECKYYEEKDVYFALEEFIRLRPINKREFTSPSIQHVLNRLNTKLTYRINRTENQIKKQHRFDYEALTRSIFCATIGIGSNVLAYHYFFKNHCTFKNDLIDIPLIVFSTIVGPLLSFLSITYIGHILNPNRDNAYLEKYKKLLTFIKKLQTYKYPNDSLFSSW